MAGCVDPNLLLAYSNPYDFNWNILMPDLQNSDDATIVASTRVACDGGGGALGHPKTYLDMGQETEVRCKYCDHVFALDPKATPEAH